MRIISFILGFNLCFLAFSQNSDARYFTDIAGTYWTAGELQNDSSFFASSGFGLALIDSSRAVAEIANGKCIWYFSDSTVTIPIKGKTLEFEYEKDVFQACCSIILQTKEGSLKFDHVATSNGGLVLLSKNNELKVEGIAADSKDGATIRANNSVFVLQDKTNWESEYLGNRVKLKAELVRTSITTDLYLGNENGEVSQGRLGRTTTIIPLAKVSVMKK